MRATRIWGVSAIQALIDVARCHCPLVADRGDASSAGELGECGCQRSGSPGKGMLVAQVQAGPLLGVIWRQVGRKEGRAAFPSPGPQTSV